MRCHVRMGLALWGLAVAAPTLVWADNMPAPANSPQAQPAPTTKPHKHGWGLFRSPMCPECQRKLVKEREGIDVPPPPEIMALGASAPIAPGADCKVCQGQNGVVTSSPVITGTMSGIVASDIPYNGEAAGYASAGGGPAPGSTVIGGMVPSAEPLPVGVGIVQSLPGRASTMPGPGSATAKRRGQADPALMQTSLAPDPIASPKAGRPHILTHVFGLDAIGRRSAEERARRSREHHASIAYGPKSAADPVNDLPASAVYGKGR